MSFKRKIADRRRSPIKDSPLRYAGQSLDEEIQSILTDKADCYAFAIAISVVISGMEWSRWYFKSPPYPLEYTIAGVAISAYCFYRIFQIKRQLQNLKQGRDGERAVGQFLDCLREKGYRVFHDIVGDGFNVDHVLIGSSGVFSIETKTISKPEKGMAKVVYDGEKVCVDGFTPDRDPITQAKAQANWLQNLIKDSTGKTVKVRPVVLYPGWFVSCQVKGVEVWVLEPKALPSFLEHERSVLTDEDVKLVSYHLSRYVREKSKSH